MAADEQPIIYLQHNLSVDSEPTLSMDSGAIHAEEGLNNPSSTTPSGSATATTTSWVKKNSLPLTLAFLVISGVIFASVVFRPGGPGNPTNVQSNLAITRGTDAVSDNEEGSIARPTYSPTTWSTYAPTTRSTYAPTTWSTYAPTITSNSDAPTSAFESSGAQEEEIETPGTTVPTPSPSVIATPFPTDGKPTFPPALDFSGLFVPTPPPSTLEPTIEITGQASETVSTEVTGPPTLPDRSPV